MLYQARKDAACACRGCLCVPAPSFSFLLALLVRPAQKPIFLPDLKAWSLAILKWQDLARQAGTRFHEYCSEPYGFLYNTH